ncbi:SDR family oxidoreductase [Martelella alba]|uniref:SDR family NAD(P)-dependent oxidoreductase n=1 Tax=Martelella alba TaxID=2590451 RepID=A0ABY2SRX1_9HYPH|nr:SDR family oxidoreductase [Martelella alba]TKI08869.1 SDR family NAD(P)-dependent oxidoreductase [Martelella alba]
MLIKDKTILVTGANRGMGAELVRSFLNAGAKKVFAGARNPSSLPDFDDARVARLQLDITKPEEVASAVQEAGDIDILYNNAGVMNYGDILTTRAEDLLFNMNVNYFGTVRMMQAFAAIIEKNGGGIIANTISVLGLAPIAGIAGYSASKAALFSATLAARKTLQPKNIDVIAVYPGPIATDMAEDLDMPKASAGDTANEIVNGIIDGQEDIYPDPISKQVSVLWGSNPKGAEKYFASL